MTNETEGKKRFRSKYHRVLRNRSKQKEQQK